MGEIQALRGTRDILPASWVLAMGRSSGTADLSRAAYQFAPDFEQTALFERGMR